MKKLKDLGVFIGGGTPETTNKNLWEGKIPWISSSDIAIDDIHNISKTRFITDEAIQSSATKLIPKGGILMVSRVGIGKFAVADEELCTSQDFTNLVTTENEYFLCYYFNARSNYFIKLSQGTSIKGFTTQDIKSAKFFIPLIEEQKQISDFLSLIDERIYTQNKIIEELKLLKRALIKKIFFHQLKFKDNNGNNYPDWKIKKLGDIGDIYSGLTGKTKENFGSGKPYIQYKQIFDQSKIDVSKCDLVSVVSNEKQNRVEKGDIFFTISSETPEEIGMSSVLLDEVDEMYLNSFCFGYRLNSIGILNPYLARYLFRSDVFRNEIIKLAQGSTRYNMSKVGFLKLELHLPCFEEQTKIADFLSTLDNKVGIETKLLIQLKNRKNYLLQNLFI